MIRIKMKMFEFLIEALTFGLQYSVAGGLVFGILGYALGRSHILHNRRIAVLERLYVIDRSDGSLFVKPEIYKNVYDKHGNFRYSTNNETLRHLDLKITNGKVDAKELLDFFGDGLNSNLWGWIK